MGKFGWAVAAGSFLLLAACTKQPANLKLPQGWRLPNLDEANDPWRNADPKKFITVKADLDGDGVPDEALLLVREKGGYPGLFVFLNKDGGFPKNIDGVEAGGPPPNNAQIRAAGIKLLPPPAGADTAALPAIEYFVSGGRRTLYFWDKTSRSFTAVSPGE